MRRIITPGFIIYQREVRFSIVPRYCCGPVSTLGEWRCQSQFVLHRRSMNKPLTLTAILVMGASLAIAQAGGSKDPKAPKNSKVELNPQPEPPGGQKSKSGNGEVNPQPAPPGVQKNSPPPKPKPQAKPPKNSKLATGSEKVSLNPQPLPPGERKAGGDPNTTKQTKTTTKKGPANSNAPVPK